MDDQMIPTPAAPDLGAEVTKRLHETIGRLFHEGLEMRTRVEAAEQRAQAVQAAAEKLKAHYEEFWAPKQAEAEDAPVPMKRKAGG